MLPHVRNLSPTKRLARFLKHVYLINSCVKRRVKKVRFKIVCPNKGTKFNNPQTQHLTSLIISKALTLSLVMIHPSFFTFPSSTSIQLL